MDASYLLKYSYIPRVFCRGGGRGRETYILFCMRYEECCVHVLAAPGFE